MKSILEPGQVPRILLVEDDAVSLAFLVAVLESLPARVDAAASCAQALRLATEAPGHALWLIDANLPDGSGAGLLGSLRMLSSRSSPASPPTLQAVALAHTASQQREDLDALIAAGFTEVLIKPLAAPVLQAAVRRALGQPDDTAVADAPANRYGKLPNWDDAAALLALNGQDAHVVSLRKLFLAELPAQAEVVATALATYDAGPATQVLHRMRASCGFVGAARLGAAVTALEQAPGSTQALRRFEDAVSDLLLPA